MEEKKCNASEADERKARNSAYGVCARRIAGFGVRRTTGSGREKSSIAVGGSRELGGEESWERHTLYESYHTNDVLLK
jgi:hypothetical protein